MASLSLLERYRGEITLPFGNGVNGVPLGAHFLFEGEQKGILATEQKALKHRDNGVPSKLSKLPSSSP